MIGVLKKVLIGGGAVAACVMCGSTFGMNPGNLKSQLGIGEGLDDYKNKLPNFKKAPRDVRFTCKGKCVFAIDANTVIFEVQQLRERDFVRTNDNGEPVFTKFEHCYKIMSKLGKVTAVVKVTNITGELQSKALYGVLLKSLENDNETSLGNNETAEVIVGAKGVILGGFINKKSVNSGVDMVQDGEKVSALLTRYGYAIPENKQFDVGAEFRVSIGLKAN